MNEVQWHTKQKEMSFNLQFILLILNLTAQTRKLNEEMNLWEVSHPTITK